MGLENLQTAAMGLAQYMEVDTKTEAQGWRLDVNSRFSGADEAVPWNLDRIDQVAAGLDGIYNTGKLDGSGSHGVNGVPRGLRVSAPALQSTDQFSIVMKDKFYFSNTQALIGFVLVAQPQALLTPEAQHKHSTAQHSTSTAGTSDYLVNSWCAAVLVSLTCGVLDASVYSGHGSALITCGLPRKDWRW
jgi:hypothetical protein